MPRPTDAEKGGHTPGPWKVFRTTDGRAVIGIGVAETGEGVTDSRFSLWGGIDDDEYHANARLIAAAPALLALADLVTIYRIEGDDAVHINVCGVKVGAFGQSTHRASALLRYEAERRGALSLAEPTP